MFIFVMKCLFYLTITQFTILVQHYPYLHLIHICLIWTIVYYSLDSNSVMLA